MDRVLAAMPARITGDASEMSRIYGSARMSGDAMALAGELRKKTASYYLMLALALAVCAAAAIGQLSDTGDIAPVERGGIGGGIRYIDARLEAKYGGESVEHKVSVAVQPRALTPEETASAIDDLKSRLPKSVLDGNASLKNITSDLSLASMDEKTGAVISWRSNRPEMISDDGHVNLIEGKAGEEVSLEADITLGDQVDSIVLKAAMGTPEAKHDFARDLETSVGRLISDISTGNDGFSVSLPASTVSGIEMKWSKPRETGAVAALFLLPILGVFVYRNRYRGMDKAVAKMREGIKRDFPDFLAKLLLLLNAGLVVTAAVAKIADDYRERRRAGEEKVFFEELLAMEERIRGANTSLAAEFSDLAVRSGQREVMRFSSILADNIDKGSALADKLMQEEGMLRAMRKKRAEERGRLAETKLTFPMALQLGAIIIITVAPAAFEMQG
jgi:hypothetical protein